MSSSRDPYLPIPSSKPDPSVNSGDQRLDSAADDERAFLLRLPPPSSQPLIPRAGEDLDSSSVSRNDIAVHGLSVITAGMLIVGEIAGVGVLSLPAAIASTGWIGFVLMLCFCMLSFATGAILGRCSTIAQRIYPDLVPGINLREPYPALGEKCFGRFGRIIISVCIDITLFGAAVVFIVLGSKLVQSVLADSSHYFNIPELRSISFCWIMPAVSLLLALLSWLGTPKDFWPVAVLAMMGTLIACILIVVNTYRSLPTIPEYAIGKIDQIDPFKFFMAVGSIMFAFSGHPAFPTIQNDMRRPGRFWLSTLYSYLIVLMMYLPVAAAGFFVFGSAVKDEISQTLVDQLPGDWINTCISLLILCHVLSAFVIVLNPVSQHLENLFHAPPYFGWARCLIRSLLVLFALVLAESIPSFGSLVSLLGGSANGLTVYVFPVLLYLRLSHLHPELPELQLELYQRVFLYEVLIIGILGCIAATVSAVVDISKQAALVPPCYICPGQNCTQ